MWSANNKTINFIIKVWLNIEQSGKNGEVVLSFLSTIETRETLETKRVSLVVSETLKTSKKS